MDYYMNDNSEYQFESISDFKWYLSCGSEIEFVWKDRIYFVGRDSDDKFGISQIYCDDKYVQYDTVDKLMTYELATGEKLKDVILQAEISSRTL